MQFNVDRSELKHLWLEVNAGLFEYLLRMILGSSKEHDPSLEPLFLSVINCIHQIRHLNLTTKTTGNSDTQLAFRPIK